MLCQDQACTTETFITLGCFIRFEGGLAMSLEKPAGIFSYKMFGLSLQALVVLTKQKDTCPSWDIAQHLRSEATQLRRVLAKLVRENILETKEGRDGGYRLKKPANTVTLARDD